MSHIQCHFLGYPQIRVQEHIVDDFISSKALTLACYLLLHPEKTHSREILASYFWGEMPEKRAKANLRQALHSIQKSLPDQFEVTRQSVKVLEDDIEIDVQKFEAIASSNSHDVKTLYEGISLYRGEFLEGIYIDDSPDIDDWLRQQRESLRLTYIDLLAILASKLFETGTWEQAEAIYRKLLNVEPWQEGAHRQLMLCLARQKKYESALTQYDICTDLLDEELGVTPMEETTWLYHRIKDARQAKTILPLDPYPFIGREDDINILRPWILNSPPRLISIIGEGGIGKTRLAIQLSKLFESTFLNRIVFVPLFNYENISFAIAEILTNAHIMPPVPNSQDVESFLIDYLKELELLVVLDNAEHVAHQVNFLQDLLEKAPHIKILITSRVPLNLRSEHIFQLEGMTYPETTSTPSWKHYDAVHLFADTAKRMNHRFVPDQYVIDICKMVAGIPLAIELAAFSASRETTHTVAENIQQNIDTLSTTMRDVPERQRSIRATFDYSWSLLNHDDRQALVHLSIFSSTFTADAAEKIADVDVCVLEELVKKSFISFADERYSMHSLLQQYCGENLAGDHGIYEKYAQYYLSVLADNVENILIGLEAIDVLNLIEEDFPNIRTAWFWSLNRPVDNDLMLTALKTLSIFYQIRGRINEAHQFFDSTLEQINIDGFTTSQSGNEILCVIYAEYAMHHYYMRNIETTQEAADKALEYAQLAKTNYAQNYAMKPFTALSFQKGDFEEGLEIVDAMYKMALQRHDMFQAGVILNNRGAIFYRQGKFEAAFNVYQESLKLTRQSGNIHRIPFPLLAIGYIEKKNDNYVKAEEAYLECIEIHKKFDNKRGLVDTYLRLGILYFDYENYDKSRHFYDECVELGYKIKKRLEVVYGLGGLYRVSLANDDEKNGRRYIKEAFYLAQEISSLFATLFSFRNLIYGLVHINKLNVAMAMALLAYYHPNTPPSIGIDELLNEVLKPNMPAMSWGENKRDNLAFIEQYLDDAAEFVGVDRSVFQNLYDTINDS